MTGGSDYRECIHNWLQLRVEHKSFPFFIMWEVWNVRNRGISYNSKHSAFHVCCGVRCFLKDYASHKLISRHKFIQFMDVVEDISIFFTELPKMVFAVQ